MNFCEYMRFFSQFLRFPAETGSLCPSSHSLVNKLVDMAFSCNDNSGIIVDLGAGTGVVSRELLNRGIPPANIAAIEKSGHCQKLFQRYCPEITLHIGDARNLNQILTSYYPGVPVRAVISSLPLRTLPAKIVYEIMLTIRKLLLKGGALIQYTYALWQKYRLERYGFKFQSREYITANMPPALIEKYII